MPAAETPVAYLGIDVGKSSHSACALDAGGGVAFRAELANRPDDIDRLLERAGSGALVVVDQKRNIGALVLARAHAHGNPCAYLPGYAEKQARGMFPGIAKTDAIDAEVIALGYSIVKALGLSQVKVLINTLGDDDLGGLRDKLAEAFADQRIRTGIDSAGGIVQD